MHPVFEQAAAALQITLDYSGDLALLDAPRRALLVSRAERNPAPATPWLLKSVAAARQLGAAGEILVSGTSRAAYDAALCACRDAGGAAIVVLLNAPAREERVPGWLPARHLLVWPRTAEKSARPAKAALRNRDLLIGWLADRGTAIHIRKDGNMAQACALLETRGCPIIRLPSATIRTPRKPSPRVFESAFVLREPWDFLTHFTRDADGPWPGEEYADYLRWLCSGELAAARDGFAALCRILHERRLRACGRLMPGRAPMVCFTARNPCEIPALRRWRRGLLRWTFTRHGLAIRRPALENLGARAVTYVERDYMQHAPLAERRFMQLASSGGMDWSAEQEWRVDGDIDLRRVDSADLLALVEHADEARHIQREFGIGAIQS